MGFSEKIAEHRIEQCKKNIVKFEEAEEAERETIREYRDMIDSNVSPFPVESLKNGIEQAKNKIVIFQKAANTERESIKNLYSQIEHNQKQEVIDKLKSESIEIIRENG